MDVQPEGIAICNSLSIPISKTISFEDYTLYHEGVSGRKRGINFSVDEDKLLVAAWLDTSLDMSSASSAKLASFWKRIQTYYLQKKNTDWPQRTVSSLCHRWSNMQQSVKRFCYFLTKVGESDASNEGSMQEARIMFHSVTKQPFRFEHCWELLKNEQKWLEWCSKEATPKRKSVWESSPLNPEPSNPESIDDATDDLHGISEEDNDERTPPRKKSAIESKKRGKALLSDDSTLSNSVFELENEEKKDDEAKIMKFNPTSDQSVFLEIQKAQLFEIKERNRIKNEKLQLEASKLKLQQSKEDAEIMLKDTSAMDPEQKEYFRIRRMEILRRTSALI